MPIVNGKKIGGRIQLCQTCQRRTVILPNTVCKNCKPEAKRVRVRDPEVRREQRIRAAKRDALHGIPSGWDV